MQEWIEIAKRTDFPPGTGRECIVGDRVLALFHIENQFYAIDGICPHQGGPLGKGCVEGSIVRCPWHGWSFDIRVGQCQLNDRVCQKTYPIRVEGERILVCLM